MKQKAFTLRAQAEGASLRTVMQEGTLDEMHSLRSCCRYGDMQMSLQ